MHRNVSLSKAQGESAPNMDFVGRTTPEAHHLLQFAMLAFEDMAKLSRPEALTECLSDDAISRLIIALARTKQPAHLNRVLDALVGDRRPLPVQALVALTVEGLSFVTSWVPAALESARTRRDVPGVRKQIMK